MSDPMDALRLPVVPITPRPAFAAELRARVAGWLGGDDDPATTAAEATTPAAHPSVTPYLSVRGGADAIRWYIDVLGAQPIGEPIVEASGRVGHMELRFGDSVVSLADEYPELDIVGPASRGGTTVRLSLQVDDCDAVYRRATTAGATGLRPPEDQFYGARAATIRDPFGHEWNLQQFTETVSGAEMADRLAGTEFALVDLGDRGDSNREPSSQPSAHDQSRIADRVGDLGYFTVDVPDPDVTADFFRQLFGWAVRQGSIPEGRHIDSIAPPGGIHGGADLGYTMYFRVDDLAAAAARVTELGGQVLSVDDYQSGGDAECRDPQGLPFHLWKPAPGY